MAKKASENMVKMMCDKCKRINYHTRRNKKTTEKLSLKKYCKWCKSHKDHKEKKK